MGLCSHSRTCTETPGALKLIIPSSNINVTHQKKKRKIQVMIGVDGASDHHSAMSEVKLKTPEQDRDNSKNKI